jgi:hypothetical protein
MTVLFLLLHIYVVVRTLNKCEQELEERVVPYFSALSNK